VSSSDSWADTDTIVLQSQTVTTSATNWRFFELDGSQQSTVPELATHIYVRGEKRDTGGGGEIIDLHPLESLATSKQRVIYAPVANRFFELPRWVELINQTFTAMSTASGTDTALDTLSVEGYVLAAP